MFCPKCGTKIEEGKRYCSNCGYDTNTVNKAVLETENIDNEVLETEKTNNTKISNNQSNVVNTLNTNENQNNVEIKQSIDNSTINRNNNPKNNNKTAIIFMLSIIVFIILFLVAVYLVFFAEDNKVENSTNKETEAKEEKVKKDAIEAKIETDNGTVTFLVPKICANSYTDDTNSNYKYYSSTNLECSSIDFMYVNYSSAEEGQEMYYTNPYMTEYKMEKMIIELNNGLKVPAIKTTENLGSVFYPVSDNSHIEISISLNEFTEQEIKKYVIVKE